LAVALPQTLLGELTALPEALLLDVRGLLLRDRKGKEGGEGSPVLFSANLCPWEP